MPVKERGRNTRPLKITDTTLRDGHQCTIATRFRTEDMLPVLEAMDEVGFYSLEVWGGATFDVTTRYLGEDPWDRLRLVKRHVKKTPLQMLLRGQNLVGYRNYADDVVRAFVHHAAECGIDIFRVFDALNDERNLEASFKAIEETGKHIQGVMCYSVTDGRMGGSVYNIDYYINKARILQEMGADSLCIKDMAGMISPYDAYELVQAIKAKVALPLQLHTHYTSGQASMAALKATEAGVDIVDCALAPLALRASQPSVEPLVVALLNTPRDTHLDLQKLLKLGEHFEQVLPKYRDFLNTTKFATIDTDVLSHQIPGGMISNLVAQLREMDALDRLEEVLDELPQTRKDMGYPPLVTPTSQIAGVQAVNNVLFGRYQRITDQVKDYAYGLYGQPPAPMERKFVKLALKDYKRGSEPIRCRAADILDPELEQAKEATKDLAKDLGDVLTYALYPTTGLLFLRRKYGKEPVPEEVKPRTLEQVQKEDELIEKAKQGLLVERERVEIQDGKQDSATPPRSPRAKVFNVYIGDEYFRVEVEPVGGSYAVSPIPSATVPAAPSSPIPSQLPAKPPPQAGPAKAAQSTTTVAAGETAIKAPMPGIVIRYPVAEGQHVKAGDMVVILEAMKMENTLPSPVDGVVMKLNIELGTKVPKEEVLVIIGPG